MRKGFALILAVLACTMSVASVDPSHSMGQVTPKPGWWHQPTIICRSHPLVSNLWTGDKGCWGSYRDKRHLDLPGVPVDRANVLWSKGKKLGTCADLHWSHNLCQSGSISRIDCHEFLATPCVHCRAHLWISIKLSFLEKSVHLETSNCFANLC